MRVLKRQIGIQIGGRQISDRNVDVILPEWFKFSLRRIGGNTKYWPLGQDEVPSFEVSGGEYALPLLKGRGINAEERRVRVVLETEMEIRKITFEATGDARRGLG